MLEANAKGDYSEASLAKYVALLEDSFIMKDLNLYRKFPKFMENPRIFNEYPRMLADIMADMFIIDGRPSQPLKSKILKHVKKVGLMNILKDGWMGVRSL